MEESKPTLLTHSENLITRRSLQAVLQHRQETQKEAKQLLTARTQLHSDSLWTLRCYWHDLLACKPPLGWLAGPAAWATCCWGTRASTKAACCQPVLGQQPDQSAQYSAGLWLGRTFCDLNRQLVCVGIELHSSGRSFADRFYYCRITNPFQKQHYWFTCLLSKASFQIAPKPRKLQHCSLYDTKILKCYSTDELSSFNKHILILVCLNSLSYTSQWTH